MKMTKRLTALFALSIFILFTPLSGFAASKIDLNHPSKITVAYKSDDIAIEGAQFNIYQVATMNENGDFKITDEFSGININLNKPDQSWRNTALALEGYVNIYDIAPVDTTVINEYGYGCFLEETPVIEKGLYLVLGHRHSIDGEYYDSEPLLLSMPSQMSAHTGEWIYDIIVNIKYVRTVPKQEEKTELTVMKVWESSKEGITHPKSITVHLISNGKKYDTVTLSDENNWKHQWTGLDANIEWSIYEEFLPDYTVEIVEQGGTYVVKNTYIPKEVVTPTPTPPPHKPEIENFGQLWWPVPILLVVGLTFIILGLARRRGAEYE